MESMQEGIDYNITREGLLVFTAHYLLQRGYCCGNGCLNCPYNYEQVPEPKRSQLLLKRQQNAEANKRSE